MKKQINPTIKAHLIRGAFYLLLLLAVCAIPFALAQRNSKVSKQSAAAQYRFQKANLALKRPGVNFGHAPHPNVRSPRADTILNHFQPQGAGQAAPIVPRQIPTGIDCDSAPGIVIHDDGGIENGYSGAPGLVTEVRFADKFTPSSYPASYTSVCLDFVILAGGPATYPIDVVVFDDDGPGGAPGTLLGELDGQTATTHLFTGGGQAPVWNSYDISSMGLNITSGSVYIGARWVPPSNNVFLSADESGPVGFAGGYWWNDFDGVWSQTQNAFPGYTANFIRAVEAGGGGSPTPTATGSPSPTPTATATATGSPSGSCPPVITQSTSNVIESGDSVSCNNGLETTENHYWRAFNMNEFTGGLAYTTTSLDMGIETATSGGITLNSITVNIYANHGSPFPGGDWQSNLVGTSGPIDIPDQSLTFPVNIPVTATVEAGALELVLEVVGADGQGLGNLMFIGANSSAETGLSYVSAVDCGITDPTPTGDVGFPDTHWVFFVNGGCGASPTPTATASGTAPSATPTATATTTATGSPTATATATPTSTARPTPTPRAKPTPRPAPTPGPRPTIKPSPWPPPSPTP